MPEMDRTLQGTSKPGELAPPSLQLDERCLLGPRQDLGGRFPCLGQEGKGARASQPLRGPFDALPEESCRNWEIISNRYVASTRLCTPSFILDVGESGAGATGLIDNPAICRTLRGFWLPRTLPSCLPQADLRAFASVGGQRGIGLLFLMWGRGELRSREEAEVKTWDQECPFGDLRGRSRERQSSCRTRPGLHQVFSASAPPARSLSAICLFLQSLGLGVSAR